MRSPPTRWVRALLPLVALAMIVGCASRPINARLEKADPRGGYSLETRAQYDRDRDSLVVLAFSGGGTRAAAFAYGVLEELRRTEITIDGRKTRLLDHVERDYLNDLPTTFVLTDEQVDRLRAAAGAILRAAPEYRRLTDDLSRPRPAAMPAAPTPG